MDSAEITRQTSQGLTGTTWNCLIYLTDCQTPTIAQSASTGTQDLEENDHDKISLKIFFYLSSNLFETSNYQQ
jgi:hypothetical protein